MQDHIISFGEKKLFYRSGGAGNAVVLVHGFTESQHIWDDFSAELSEHYRVITPDLPGHGNSECIDDTHTMEVMAECIRHILEAEQEDRAVMIGHSMGGYAAMAFAEKYPEMLAGLGLFHSSALADTAEANENRRRVIEFVKNNHVSFISSFIPDLFAPQNRQQYQREIDVLVSQAAAMSTASIIAAQEGMRVRSDRAHVLQQAGCPVLFIAGKLDTRVPFEKVEQQAALPADATFIGLEDVAHMGYIEARDTSLQAIRAFLEKVYGKPGAQH